MDQQLVDKFRSFLLKLAERSGYPAVALRRSERLMGGQPCWERFIAATTRQGLWEAYQALKAGGSPKP